MRKRFFLITLLLSGLTALAGDLSKDLIWQMGGDAPIDTSIKLNVNAEWIATPGFGNGLEFFGDGSWAAAPNFPEDKIGDEVTISFFFKCHDLIPKDKKKTCGAIFSFKYQWLGRVYKSGNVFGAMANKKAELKGIFSSLKIIPEKWYHLAMAWSAKNSQFTLYLDGERVGVRSDNITPMEKLSGHQFAFGMDPDGSCFNGVVADFRIYNRSLSPKEIKNLASKTEVPFTAKPNFPKLYAFITEAISDNPIIPDSRIDAKFLAKTIKFTATPGEYEPASFVLRPTTDFKDVTFELSDLKGTTGTIPSSALDLKLVKCWYQGPAAWRNDAAGKYPSVMVPELLLNDYNLVRVDEKTEKNFLRHGKGTKASYENVSDRKDNNNLWQKNMTIAEYPIYDAKTLQALPLKTNRNQQFFLTLHAPENAKAGNYTGSILIKTEGNKLAELAVKVKILPFKLAEARTYYNLKKPYMTSVYYNSHLREDDQGGITGYYRNSSQIRNELKNLLAHGVRYPTNFQLNAGSGDISKPELQKLFIKMLLLRKEAGLPNKPMHLTSAQKINFPESLPASEEGLQKLTDRATMVMNWIEKELGHRDVYFYGIDEAKGDIMKAQVPFFEAIHKAGGKVFSAGYDAKTAPPGNFAAIGKVQNLLICAAYPSREEAAKWHSVGHEVWCYAYPQAGNENPEIFRRNFGLVVYKNNYDGSATFCYYMAFGHPWNDFDSTLQRDLNFVYPTADGVVDTIAFEGYREGYDDIRYATTLKLECQEAKLSGNPARIAAADEAEDFLEKRDVYLKDLTETRLLIIKRILKLRKLAGKDIK